MIYLHKLLPLIASPLGLIVFLLLMGLAYRRRILIILGCFLFVISSLPITGKLIWQDLERQYPPKTLKMLGSYDAIVVLSGMLSVFKHDDKPHVEWIDPDRFFAGVDLLKSGKAPTLIFTSGKMPWDDFPAEGELLKTKAIDLGVNKSQILLSGIVTNTEEESVAVKRLMKKHEIKKILLITSSFHMPRAKFLFDRQKIDSEAFPVDFKATGVDLTWLTFLPSASGFERTSSGIREYIGRLYYRYKYL